MSRKPKVGDVVWYAPGNDRQQGRITAISGSTGAAIKLLTGPHAGRDIEYVPWDIISPVERMSERYRGRIIDPRACELSDGTGWTAEVYVAEEEDPATVDSQFSLKETFPTKEAAIQAAIAAGRREVDKRIGSTRPPGKTA